MPDTTSATAYRTPSPEIASLMDAAPFPEYRLSPDGGRVLILEPAGLAPIGGLARPELRLAGLRFNPDTFSTEYRGEYVGLWVLDLAGRRRKRRVRGLPRHARLSWVKWAPDGSAAAFALVKKGRLTLWVADAAEARAAMVSDLALNAVGGPPCCWLPDASGFLCRLAPPRDAAPPPAPRVPSGPVVDEHDGTGPAPARTNPDLLKTPEDEERFAYFMASELALVPRSGDAKRLGVSGMVFSAEPSPDMNFLLVQSFRRHFSRQVPCARFPMRAEVLDMDGRCVKVLADLPLAENVPLSKDAVRCGPRDISWRPDRPATVAWVEAADGGDPDAPADVRDRVFMLGAPFQSEPTELAALKLRCRRVFWGHERLALVREEWRKTRTVQVWRLDPSAPESVANPLFAYGQQDRYRDPGTPMMKATGRGGQVMATCGPDGALLLAGPGGGPEGDRPFVDAFDPFTEETRRLWQSQPPCYEEPVGVAGAGLLLFTRESLAEPPALHGQPLGGGAARRLVSVPHPAPALAGVRAAILRYRRADGVELTGKLCLPPGKTEEDGPFPTLLWAYPTEFKDPASAGQVKTSPFRFPVMDWRSPLVWLAKGCAVLDRPDIPIVGEGDAEPNDTYVEQLVASAEAAVEELVRRGVAERGRIAVGGHSYGAFMTANLLAHTRLFCAGVARSGAYNRTLTPFSFQAEERTLWQAPEVYLRMSPFMHADRIRDPLLLIHGMADENEGTYTVQSERMFHALKGLGAKARLVLLPFEGHGYRARESVMHMLWETEQWLVRHLGWD